MKRSYPTRAYNGAISKLIGWLLLGGLGVFYLSDSLFNGWTIPMRFMRQVRSEYALSGSEKSVVQAFLRDIENGAFHKGPTARHNLTVCALVTAEERWIDEFILHHALLGVSKFYFYDTLSLPETANAVEPWVATGLVSYHQLQWKR